MYKPLVVLFVIFLFTTLFTPIISNEKPIACKYQNSWFFPIFSNNISLNYPDLLISNSEQTVNWKLVNYEFVIFPICNYLPSTIDVENANFKSPFDKQLIKLENHQLADLPLKNRHWLGTTQNGNDVLSNLIYGTKLSLGLGFLSMLLTAIIGIMSGALMGYYEYVLVKIKFSFLIKIFILFLIVNSFIYYFKIPINAYLFNLVFIIAILLLIILKWSSSKLLLVKLPIDRYVLWLLVIIDSIPNLLFIIVCMTFLTPSFISLVCVISFLNWTSIARLTRSEYLKAKKMDYVIAYQAMGMANWSIIFKKILPNVFPVIAVQLIYVMASAMIIEASLSFIGLGLPHDVVSWGTIIAEAREKYSAWWLVIFPGMCLTYTVYMLNKVRANMQQQIRL